MKYKILFLSLVVFCSVLPGDNENTENLPDFEKTGDWIVIPYLFTTDATGFAGGVGTIAQGVFQPQTTFVGTLFYGASQDIITNGIPETSNFMGGLISYSNIKVPYTERFFLSAWGYSMSVPMDTFYLDGSNDSDEENVLTSSGLSQYFTVGLNYVLPIGEGVDNPDGMYDLRDGFAMGREGYGNGIPFETGRTSLYLKAFYQYQDIENWKESEPWKNSHTMPTWNDSGLRLYLEHDNTDYDLNPSRGYNFQIQYSKDFGWGDNLQSWSSLEFKYSKYFNLETLSFTKQNVLALNFWTAYSPSWDNSEERHTTCEF